MKHTALVTGATQGIGLHTATRLAQTGDYKVIIHARSAESGARALKLLAAESDVRGDCLGEVVTGDLGDLAQVRSVAAQVRDQVRELDVLINNAGVFTEGPRRVSAQGHELTYAVNVLAPFALTRLLLPVMRPDGGHVLNTASLSAASRVPWDDLQLETSYSDHKAYSLSKVLDIMFTLGLHRGLQSLGCPNLRTNCLDPGTVDTRMLRQGWSMSGIPLSEANDTFRLATTEASAGSGKYYVGNRVASPPRVALDPQLQDRLWDVLEGQAAPALATQ